MPAMLRAEPLILLPISIFPLLLQYWKIIWSFSFKQFRVFSSAWYLPSPCATGIFITWFKEYFDVTKKETGIEISEGDKDSVNQLLLESIERKGFKFWDSSPAKQFQLKFDELLEKSVDEVEITIYDE